MINRRFMIVPPALPSGGHAEPLEQTSKDFLCLLLEMANMRVPSVIDFTDNLRIDGSAMTEMHRDRETDCREEVRGEAQRGGAGTA
jgi:hypothetical protein